MHTREPKPRLPELSDQQQRIVREELRSILDSKLFSKSKRYPSLIEYIVLKTLECDTDALREQNIGQEVFEKPPGYDSSTDPIVRTIAGEVRRRLAAYYSEHPEAAVHIELPAGGYIAAFHFRPPAIPESHSEHPSGNTIPVEPAQKSWRQARAVRWGVLLVVVLLAAGSMAIWRYHHASAEQEFWRPVLKNTLPAIIVVGRSPGTANGASAAGSNGASTLVNTSMSNAIAAAQICKMIRDYTSDCNVLSAQSATLTDLRGKAAVLIGALDNPWTLQLLAPFRYQFRFEETTPPAPRVRFILDQNHSEDSKAWRIAPSGLTSGSDYAIVARFHSEITDSTAVVVGGLSQTGTTSASEFLSNSDDLRNLFSLAPKDWRGFNFEAVLQVDVIQGNPGHTRVIATQFW